MRIWVFSANLLFVASLCGQDAIHLTRAEQENFLLTAKVIKTKGSQNGITGTIRATLSDGKITHDGQIQTIDERKNIFQGTSGTEMNFRDCYCYNIAGYRLDKLLDLRMIPVSVLRKYEGKNASFTWWIDNVLMEEKERVEKKMQAPDVDDWNLQMYFVRVFDQLIYNVDRNLGNLMITKDWKIWMIDHTRAFRLYKEPKDSKALVKIDTKLLARMKELNEPVLVKELDKVLSKDEIKTMLARRDKIVQFFEKGGASVLYDYPRRAD